MKMYQTLIDCETVARHINAPNWVIVDCRFDLMQPQAGLTAYVAGHIPGALYADLEQGLSGPVTAESGRHPLPDPATFAQRLGRWGIGNASQVVVYDAGNGAYAVRLWWMLRWLGHQAVALLDGGFSAWQVAGLPLSQEIPQPSAVLFEAQLLHDSHVTTSQVNKGIRDGTLCVVDARAAARYAGEIEPIDPVAGHIPTARNYPFEANLDAQGRFLAADQLKDRFAALAGKPEQVVHMCGSGVTACHNLLAMEIAGYTGSKLYAGSWSEWIRNPKNPVSKGYNA
jgi:thiosulfate/3-mercaptopyruvate sulfurtransferase